MKHRLSDYIKTTIDNRGRNPEKYHTSEKYPVIDNYLIKNSIYPDLNAVNRYIDTETFENFLRGYVHKNMPLMTLVGNGIGNVTLAPSENVAIIQNTIGFECNDNINEIFLYYYLLYKQELIKKFDRGSGQPSIRKTDLLDMEVDIPSMDIQNKISDILFGIDEKIELNNEINSNLYSQINAIFKSWVIYMDNSSGNMPSDWSMIPLQALCTTVTKGTTPTTLGKQFTDGGINFVKAEAILDNHYIDSSKFAYIDEETNQMLKRSIIEKGDIVFTIAGSLGRFSLVDETIIPANTNQAVAIIRPNGNLVSPEYLYSFFVGNWHNDYYSKRVQQAVQANLSLTTIKSLPIVVMSDADKEKYTELITPLVKMIKSNEQESRILSATRDSLLPKLMSGEIDLSSVSI